MIKRIKKISLIILLLCFSNQLLSQFKLTNQGFVGIGTNVPWEKLHVANGSAIIANNGRSFRIYPWTGVSIGSNYGTISCWEIDSKWNQINAKKFYKVSDANLKKDITPINNPIALINQLNGVYFKYKNDSVIMPYNTIIENPEFDFGFIAQDVEQILPQIVTETDFNVKAIDYNAITPILVEAFKQQMSVIDSLYNKVNQLEEQINSCCGSGQRQGNINPTPVNENNSKQKVNDVLHQNKPNPYNEKTSIDYQIESEFSNASIMIFNLQGTLLKSFPITTTGKGNIIINNGEFKSGMYLYSLVINDTEIDTKRMIVSE